jgi:transcriptional regulator with XRE-family HTH domain
MPRSAQDYLKTDALIGQRIRLLRHACGISAAEMAWISGMDIGDYARCEIGESRFTTAMLSEIARALKVNMRDIVGVLDS